MDQNSVPLNAIMGLRAHDQCAGRELAAEVRVGRAASGRGSTPTSRIPWGIYGAAEDDIALMHTLTTKRHRIFLSYHAKVLP